MLTTTTFVAYCLDAVICSLDCLFTRFSYLTLGCLPFSLYTFRSFRLGLARDYRTTGFPEFGKIHVIIPSYVARHISI